MGGAVAADAQSGGQPGDWLAAIPPARASGKCELENGRFATSSGGGGERDAEGERCTLMKRKLAGAI